MSLRATALLLLLCLPAAAAAQDNRVLQLDGDGDGVELPAGMLKGLTEAAVEAWVRYDHFGYYAQWFSYGRRDSWHGLGANVRESSNVLQYFAYAPDGALHVIRVPTDLQPDTWVHMVLVSGPGGMRFYLNGVRVGHDPYAGSFAAVSETGDLHLGLAGWWRNLDFRGQLDDVRIWDFAPDDEQVLRMMGGRPEARAPGLLAWWGFDDGTAADPLGGQDGRLVGDARIVAAARPNAAPRPAQVSGQVVDDRGAPAYLVTVDAVRDGRVVCSMTADEEGRFGGVFFSAAPVELVARRESMVVRRAGVVPGAGGDLHLQLHPATGLRGTATSLDGVPWADLVIERVAVEPAPRRDEHALTRTDELGRYELVDVSPGRYLVRAHTPTGYAYATAPGSDRPDTFVVTAERPPVRADLHLPRVRHGAWRQYGVRDGLSPDGPITDLYRAPAGPLYLATSGGGLWSFDGTRFEGLDVGDGLPSNDVRAVRSDADGVVWAATAAGIASWDGGAVVVLDSAGGLPSDDVRDVLPRPDGSVWAATARGLARWDGHQIRTWTTADGLPGDEVSGLCETDAGDLWVATVGGLARWDGATWVPFGRGRLGPRDARWQLRAFPDGRVLIAGGLGTVWSDGRAFVPPFRPRFGGLSTIVDAQAAPDGSRWVLTAMALYRMQGERLTDWRPRQEGTGQHLLVDVDGTVWLSRGQRLLSYRPDDVRVYAAPSGLANAAIKAVLPDTNGVVWAGSDAGLWRIAADGRTVSTFPDFADVTINDMARIDDRVYVAGYEGVWRLPAAGVPGTEERVAPAYAYDLLVDDDGELLISGASDLQRLTASGLQTLALSNRWETFQEVLQDEAGQLWMAANNGVWHRRDDSWEVLGSAQGLEDTTVNAIAQVPDDGLWIGTESGVFRRRASGFERLLPPPGLSVREVVGIRAHDGKAYLATNAGVVVTDGTLWSVLDTRAGLPDETIFRIEVAPDGDLWIGTQQGLVCYRPRQEPPAARIVSVRAGALPEAPGVSTPVATGTRVTVEYSAVDLVTDPTNHWYRWRLSSADGVGAWSAPTRDPSFEWTPQDVGSIAFEVQAIDRDLNVSAPARLDLSVYRPWYADAWYLVPGGSGIAGLVLALAALGTRSVRQRQEAARLREELLVQEREVRQRLEESHAELQAAHAQLQHEIEQRQRSEARAEALSRQEAERWDIEGFVGHSPTIGAILRDVRQLQEADTTSVLITGESGTGKELIARALHSGGMRAGRPFVPVNCGALPEGLAESVLFGHRRGAFTGADRDSDGVFVAADGGTLFLDEIGDMALETQVTLLRTLEDGRVRPVGAHSERKVDVRIIAATNADLLARVGDGAFRQDLYYRLARFTVAVPPLRQRPEDIPLLAAHFLHYFAEEMRRPEPALSAGAVAALKAYAFPGNVRELKNMMEYALIKSEGAELVQAEHLPFADRAARAGDGVAAGPTASPEAAEPGPRPRDGMSSEEAQILAHVVRYGQVTNADCRELLGVNRRRATYLLDKLTRRGHLVRQGSHRSVHYVPSSGGDPRSD